MYVILIVNKHTSSFKHSNYAHIASKVIYYLWHLIKNGNTIQSHWRRLAGKELTLSDALPAPRPRWRPPLIGNRRRVSVSVGKKDLGWIVWVSGRAGKCRSESTSLGGICQWWKCIGETSVAFVICIHVVEPKYIALLFLKVNT